MIVVDASVVGAALAIDAPEGDRARDRLAGEVLHAPACVDLEVTSALRRLVLRDLLDPLRAALALLDLSEVGLQRHLTTPYLARIWDLRDNVTPFDAGYLALAEVLDVPFVTAHARLARAPGLPCRVELLA